VFFSTGDPDVCEAVAPQERSVPADADPIRAAFDELVAGPTADEAEGAFSFFSAETKDAIRSAKTDDGLLIVDFDDFRAALTPAGANTSCGSGLLLAELTSTAFQFDAVDVVRYELEGSCDEFGEWLQRGCIEIDRAEWAEGV
jgi:spore germination protein GerM